jgi:N-acetylglucosamine-6-phosphate deacetylase
VRAGPPHDVLVVDGRIAAVGPELVAPAGTPVLDVPGAVVAPGFIDLQINGAHGIDLAHEPERLGELAALLPRYGVTAFCPTIVSSPPGIVERALAAWRAWTADGTAAPAHAAPLGLHLEGPMLNPARRGAHAERHLRPPSLAVIGGWSPDAGVALVTLAPELAGALDVVTTLVDRGVVVAAGHTDASSAEIEVAVAAGVTMVTHLYNAMRPFAHRDPGPVGATLAGAVPVAGLIADGVHVHPLAVAAAWRALGPGWLALVTDAVSALGQPDGPAGGVRLPDGTLAGSTLTMDAAVRNLRAFTGCSLGDAVTTATATPAAVLRDDSRGELVAGRRGDLAVLTTAGEVVATVIAGAVAWRA